MFIKIVTVVFYAAIALWAFGVGVPLLLPVIGICAAILAVVHAM